MPNPKYLAFVLEIAKEIPDDGQRAFGAVEIVADVKVGLRLPEIGQDLGVGPFNVASRRPVFEVLGQPPQVDLSVDGAGPADHLALGHVDLAPLLVDGAPEGPGDG